MALKCRDSFLDIRHLPSEYCIPRHGEITDTPKMEKICEEKVRVSVEVLDFVTCDL